MTDIQAMMNPTRNRQHETDTPCPKCGWVMVQLPTAQECGRCAHRIEVPRATG